MLDGVGSQFLVFRVVPDFGRKVRDFILHESARETKIATCPGKDAVLAVGVPSCDAVLEFGRSVEVEFLGALNGPVLEDAVAAW